MPGRCIETKVVCQECGLVRIIDPFCLRTSDVQFCSLPCIQAHRIREFTASFWSRVNKDGPVPANQPELGPCWLWVGNVQPQGYGHPPISKLGPGHRSRVLAHRLAWEFTYGPIPADLCVLHRCDNPPCVNPDHLALGTHLENIADMKHKRRGRGPNYKGSKHGMAKLTEEQVLEIRRRYRRNVRGCGYTSLAKEFGVHYTLIYRIVHRKNWRHI